MTAVTRTSVTMARVGTRVAWTRAGLTPSASPEATPPAARAPSDTQETPEFSA